MQVEQGARFVARDFGWHHPGRANPAFSGLNFEIAPGQKVLLVGPSGAGKSTLLHAMAGLLVDEDDQTQLGELTVNGQAPTEARGVCGLMQQDPESSVVLARVGDDVAFGPENLGVPREDIWGRVTWALDAVGLGSLPLDRSTSALSGGQKQRLGLAGILAMHPGALLLDEPTANLDPAGVLEVRDAVLAAATASGATLLVIEHRVGIWAEYVDRILVLDAQGGISHDGPPQQVLDQAREQLIAGGVWVPGYLPHPPRQEQTLASPPRADASPGPGRDRRSLLLEARDLSITRQLPTRRQRKERSRAIAAGQVPSLDLRAVAQGINLTLAAGEHLALLGLNGAGKSTLALTLAGLLYPAGGQVLAHEALTASLPERHRVSDPASWPAAELADRIGLVFQEPEQQFLAPTVRAELEFGPRHLARVRKEKIDEDRLAARTDELLARLRLTHLADANPFTLSGGEKRRLSVATALATEPAVLVLDEPTFGQDATTWAELVTLIKELLNRGLTVISVTHDIDYVAALGGTRLTLQKAEPTHGS
ncbi:ABC transporter ATP-binding protein [Rothia sp. SD9660Na]|uniref:ABC transporter ATP-binding protein n=1 Tax=Rothia sp. SD9660Na TaxID=3047030 RepID=UPI0024B8C33D|nr:ABC transporter ATP-binding protein [Rothia sp. SD9660Na]WHS50129.1 ABC transporter ATP-binding protein [Rothia sp. SD9660Na]